MTAWLEIQIETQTEAAEILAAEVGPIVGGVELRDAGTLLATAPDRTAVVVLCRPEQRETVLAVAEDVFATARDSGLVVDPVAIRERGADEAEWRDVWKQFFRTTRVSPRFTVRPSWDEAATDLAEFVIDLDPGRAFGTGAHPSTRLVLGLAEMIFTRRPHIERFLDLGCGSGILAIAAARLWPTAAGLAVDNDPEATACSAENFERNHITSVALLTGTLSDTQTSFDIILANIQADVLCSLTVELADKVARNGHLVLSGILTDQTEDVLAAFTQVGFSLVCRQDEGEWSGLLLARG